nr:putative glucosesorbosone dehydrogenase [uncultured bacterium]
MIQQPEAVKEQRAQRSSRGRGKVHLPRPENEEEREREPRPDQPDEALRWRMLQMVDENGRIPDNALIKAWERARRMPVDSPAWPKREKNQETIRRIDDNVDRDPNVAGIQPDGWTWLGPGNIGGRIRSILIHPTNPDVMWIGSVTGGIWKTINGGLSWVPLDDFMGNLSVTTMVMSPSNPNVIYAGTGEGVYLVNHVRDLIRGAGVFKSIDGGTTWSQLSSTANDDWYHVSRLAIHPANSQIMLAATSTGIWHSFDAGATWTKQDPFAMLDINFNPSDGHKCVASGSFGSGVRYSIDTGLTWNPATGIPLGGRIEVAYAKSNPTIVYASIDNRGGELYVSTDGGQTFTLRSSGENFFMSGGSSQGWYDNALWVDPTNSNTVIVGGIDLWRSTDGGSTFTKISRWESAPNSAHADHHVIVESSQFNGATNRTVFFGNDGGLYRAVDVYNVSQFDGWTELNNNLGITQFYSVAGNPTSGRVIGGTQDNGTLRYTGNIETWNTPFGGDGGWSAADPTDPDYLYGEYVYLNVHRSSNGGVSSEYISGQFWNGSAWAWKDAPFQIPDAVTRNALFIAPFVIDPNNSNRILAGGASLWRTNDAKRPNTNAAGPSWDFIGNPSVSLISAIAIAKGNSDVIWIGYQNGDVYFTTNGTAPLPAWTRVDTNSIGLPDRYCTRITIDPTNTNRVYVTFGGFSPDNVWRTQDNGSSWSNITANLPNAPVRSLAVWERNPNQLYVGTEVGIFASANGGESWSGSNDGPTNCSVDELFWMNDTLVAATHGRGMFSIKIEETCTYSLDSKSQNYTSLGGSGSFSVLGSAGCEWSAVSNVPWIETSSTGSGNGLVEYSVAVNTGSDRTGTITVGDQTFTVIQLAPAVVPPTIQLSASSFSGSEADGSVTITVTRAGDDSGSASVNFRTFDSAGLQSCTLMNSRGSERCDYVTSLGTVRFGPGESTKTIFVPLIDDVLVEGTETFNIGLNNAVGATLGSTNTATITILDDDSVAPTSNPIDTAQFFVRQQYLDILNRQPDSVGLSNWMNTLSQCPNSGFGEPKTSDCDRLHVAAGFFQSDEFLNRGYWAFRFYMVSFGQRPTYAQFIPDMAQVGGPKSPAEEETSKVGFADAFVQRPEFVARYGTLSGQALANALLQTAGLPSSTFTVTGNMTNAQILRGIAETPAVLNRFLTEGTVSIQYFGFLRRDPDTIGYKNNIDTLNSDPDNLRHMIFIFIYSTEYRSRFGPQ